MKTSQDRQNERREKKLEEVRQQVASGSLIIRQMTPAERKSNPPRPPKPKRP